MKPRLRPFLLALLMVVALSFALPARALIEARVDCNGMKEGEPPPTANPVSGMVAVKPTSVSTNDAAGASVRVETVEAFKGKAIVVDDRSGGEEGKYGWVNLGGIAKKDAVHTGKVYLHFDWVSLARTTGNIGFVLVRNASGATILSLMFDHTTTGLVILCGDQKTSLKSVLGLGMPVSVKIMLDLDGLRYEVSLNESKMAEGALAPENDNSFLGMSFSTATSGVSRFAVKNLIISPNPIQR